MARNEGIVRYIRVVHCYAVKLESYLRCSAFGKFSIIGWLPYIVVELVKTINGDFLSNSTLHEACQFCSLIQGSLLKGPAVHWSLSYRPSFCSSSQALLSWHVYRQPAWHGPTSFYCLLARRFTGRPSGGDRICLSQGWRSRLGGRIGFDSCTIKC